MSEEKNLTSIEEKYQQWLKLDLELWERDAIMLRAEGYGYPDIVEEIGNKYPEHKYADQSYRNLFYVGGRLRKEFDLWREIRAEEGLSEAQKELKASVREAAITLSILMGKGNSGAVRLGAATAILDRNLGKPKQQMQLSGEGFEKDAEKLETIIGLLTDGGQTNESGDSEEAS